MAKASLRIYARSLQVLVCIERLLQPVLDFVFFYHSGCEVVFFPLQTHLGDMRANTSALATPSSTVADCSNIYCMIHTYNAIWRIIPGMQVLSVWWNLQPKNAQENRRLARARSLYRKTILLVLLDRTGSAWSRGTGSDGGAEQRTHRRIIIHITVAGMLPPGWLMSWQHTTSIIVIQ